MIAYYSAKFWEKTLPATREVIKQASKQSEKRLTKVNHSKEWGAKPLV